MPSEDSPLLFAAGLRRTERARPLRNKFLISVISLLGILCLLRDDLGLWSHSSVQLKEIDPPLYFVPRSKFGKNSRFPVHIEVPENGHNVEYTLIERSIASGSMLEAGANQSGNATYVPVKCNLKGITDNGNVDVQIDIKAEAIKVFKLWDRCKAAPDYKVPNGGNFKAPGSRRLLTQSIVLPQEWDYPVKGQNVTPGIRICGSPSFPCPKISECEATSTKLLCSHLEKCSNPVCSSYYIEPEVERICGICTMAAPANTVSCWSSLHALFKCMGMA